MTFVATTRGELVALDRIVRLQQTDDRLVLRGWFADEDGDAASALFYAREVLSSGPVFPNTSGYQYGTHYEGDNGQVTVVPVPIIAWQVQRDGLVPIIADDPYLDDYAKLAGGHALIAPSGAVHVGELSFDTVFDFENYLIKQVAARERRLAKAEGTK